VSRSLVPQTLGAYTINEVHLHKEAIIMTMYDSCSEQYWKNRKKRRPPKAFLRISLLCFFAFVSVAALVVRKLRPVRQINENEANVDMTTTSPQAAPRMLVATELHYKRCADHFQKIRNTAQNECLMTCNEERTSIPRPTMYQACIHGCNSAYFRSAEISCHGGTTEKISDEVDSHSYQQCSRFEGLRPKVELVALCRKYHDNGSKQGYLAAKSLLDEIVALDSTSPGNSDT
jgi:hypothetical protein